MRTVVEKSFEVKVGDCVPENPILKCGCCCGFMIFITLFSMFVPGSIRQLGQFKYGLTRHTVSGVIDLNQVYEPGRYYIGFWQEFIEFPSTLETIQFSDINEPGVQQLGALRSRDKDGKQIYLDISVQYKLIPSEIGQTYREMTLLYENVIISDLRDALSKSCNMFSINEAWENYASVVNIFRRACEQALRPRHADCWDLQLWGVKLDDSYTKALVRTQVRKQAQRTAEAQKRSAEVRATTQVILAEYQKNVTVLQSNGTAQQIIITREAQANAEFNLIKAQAQSLQLVKDNLRLPGLTMNDSQLIIYQRLLMLQAQKAASFVYQAPPAAMEAVNVYSSNKIMLGARRLQVQEAAGRRLPAEGSEPAGRRLPAAAAPSNKARQGEDHDQAEEWQPAPEL